MPQHGQNTFVKRHKSVTIDSSFLLTFEKSYDFERRVPSPTWLRGMGHALFMPAGFMPPRYTPRLDAPALPQITPPPDYANAPCSRLTHRRRLPPSDPQYAPESKAPRQRSKIEPMTTCASSPRLILASASPARRKLLEDSRIAFTVRVSSVDEDAALATANEQARAQGRAGLTPAETASLLAQLKAQAVAAELAAEGVRDALVLGCDSVFEFEGVAYGKPHTAEAARERISAMSGNYGVLHTGHALVDLRGIEPGAELPTVSELRSATVHFDELSPEEIEAYIATGEPLWVAGSFTLDGYGSAFIRGIEGEFHTVVGLSIHALRDMLRRREVAVTELWLAPEDED